MNYLLVAILLTATAINGLPTYNVFQEDPHQDFDIIALDNVQSQISQYLTYIYTKHILPPIFDNIPEFHIQDKDTDVTVKLRYVQLASPAGLIQSINNNLEELKSNLVIAQLVKCSGKYEAKGTLNGQQIDVKGDFTMESTNEMSAMNIYLKVINPSGETFDQVYGIKKIEYDYSIEKLISNFNGMPADIKSQFENAMSIEVVKFFDKLQDYSMEISNKFFSDLPLAKFLEIFQVPKIII